MLRELSDVRQIKGGHPRRWFQSDDEDLVIWYDCDGSIYGFQLCYNRTGIEKALTWMRDRGFSHDKVDAGTRSGLNYGRTPILVADGTFDAPAMKRRFEAISVSLPEEVRALVLTRLNEYPDVALKD